LTIAVQTREGQSIRGAGVHLYPTDLVTRDSNFKVALADASAVEKRQADYTFAGTADDLELAIVVTALPAGGGKITVSSGTFVGADPYVLVKANVTIEGQGLSTLLTHDGATPLIDASGAVGCIIRNLGTDGGGITTAGSTGCVFDYWKSGVYQGGAVLNTVQVLTAWLELADPTQAIGTIPADALVLSVDVWVQEAFNAGTTNLLTIGFTADPDYYMDDLDVTAVGVKTPIATAIIKTIDATERAMVAYYSQTGGAATTGAALITITYIETTGIPA